MKSNAEQSWYYDPTLPGRHRHIGHPIPGTNAEFVHTQLVLDDGRQEQDVELNGSIPASADHLQAAALVLLGIVDRLAIEEGAR